jgi:hypothetical protein
MGEPTVTAPTLKKALSALNRAYIAECKNYFESQIAR